MPGTVQSDYGKKFVLFSHEESSQQQQARVPTRKKKFALLSNTIIFHRNEMIIYFIVRVLRIFYSRPLGGAKGTAEKSPLINLCFLFVQEVLFGEETRLFIKYCYLKVA